MILFIILGLRHIVDNPIVQEWMASTPLHVALYNAFGWEPPAFGHVPLLTEKSGQKLSKRNVDIDISFFRDKEEVFPEALNNFAALLGWSHSRKSDIFSLKDLEQIVGIFNVPVPIQNHLPHNANRAYDSSISNSPKETPSFPSKSCGSFKVHMRSDMRPKEGPKPSPWSIE